MHEMRGKRKDAAGRPYSKYLAERTAKGKSNSPPKNTTLELEELLEELFEG